MIVPISPVIEDSYFRNTDWWSNTFMWVDQFCQTDTVSGRCINPFGRFTDLQELY